MRFVFKALLDVSGFILLVGLLFTRHWPGSCRSSRIRKHVPDHKLLHGEELDHVSMHIMPIAHVARCLFLLDTSSTILI